MSHNMNTNLKALSIRQPWAWMILHAGKDIENRARPTQFRGRFLIHAARTMTLEEWEKARVLAPSLPVPALLERGGIVGEAELVDCVGWSASPWYAGGCAYVLANVKPLPFRPCQGALGFFDPKFRR
jgi:ASCH domain